MKDLIGVYGAAGCGRGLMPILRLQYPDARLVFIDDGLVPDFVNGHEVVGWQSFLSFEYLSRYVSLAIAQPKIRAVLAEKCEAAAIPLIEVRAQSVVQMDDVKLGDGACLSPFVTLTSNISIGKCLHANLYSYIEHDCRIGNFVTLAPGAKVNGAVQLGDRVYIGSGAIVRQGISIGNDAVVGMGAVVVRDVAANSTVVGNPAKPLLKV